MHHAPMVLSSTQEIPTLGIATGGRHSDILAIEVLAECATLPDTIRSLRVASVAHVMLITSPLMDWSMGLQSLLGRSKPCKSFCGSGHLKRWCGGPTC